MKTALKIRFLLPVCTAGLHLVLAGRLTAQTFTTLHSFTSSDGDPQAGLILSGGTLYGTAQGTYLGDGTVFAVNTDGTDFLNLYSFSALSFADANSDGAFSRAGLLLSSNTLYGMAWEGGSSSKGTVFSINTNGADFTTLHSFAGAPSDGAFPESGFVLSGNTLYGTSNRGGSGSHGTVFAVNTDSTGYTILYSFTKPSSLINSDGASPQAGLILSGDTLYGTATIGGSSGNGTVFALNTNGMGYRTLHVFTSLLNSTNSDGASPEAGLILSRNTLYGTATLGGSSGNGTVFAVNTDGTGFTTLHSFTATSGSPSTNSDGANPQAGLILSGDTLYGTAANGGSGSGTVFTVNTNGTGFKSLYAFTPAILSYVSIIGPIYTNSDGANPQAGLILSRGTLYGTTTIGGSLGTGTAFSLSLGLNSPPQLTLIPSPTNLILTWPSDATGFTLQSTTNLGSSAVWSTNSPAPVVVNGQNTVTNLISGTQQFFRLSQ